MLKHKETVNMHYENVSHIRNYKSILKEGNVIKILFEGGKIQITYFHNDIIKIFIGDLLEESKNTRAIKGTLNAHSVNFKEDDNLITIFGNRIDTVVQKSNLKISFLDKSHNLICEDFKPAGRNGSNLFVTKANDCIAYYGFGEKGAALNKRGTYIENYNTDDPSNNDNTKLFYKTIPFYIAHKLESPYGIFFDNSFRSYFDMGFSSKDFIFFGAEGGQLQYYFIPGKNIKEVITNYSLLTGTMEMPPMWSLGYQQCRYSYASQAEVEELSSIFRKKSIPCDTIYLDIHYMNNYKVMTFNEDTFINPKSMIEKLSQDGFKVVTILDPGVKAEEGYGIYERGLKGDHFVKKADGELYDGVVWPGKSVFPDFSGNSHRQWWKEELKNFLTLGISGIWNDMNEPAAFDNDARTMPDSCLHDSDEGILEHKEFHNLYGMEMSRCSKEAQEELRENIRSFSMTRASFAGGQRYSSIWTGDNQSTWHHLRMSIPMNCNLGLSGFAFVGNDVGGFGGDVTEELFIRWMEVGTFLPIFRNHSAVFTRRQEPWSFGLRAEAIAKKAIELRYRLMPYLYNQYYIASSEGLPVFRPLVLNYPDDLNVIEMYSEFMFGEDMLIAPVLYEGEKEKLVYLPEGSWYNYFTHEKYIGGRFYNIELPLEEIGVFVREGAIIPVYEEHYNYIGERELEVTLEIFKGEGKTFFYEDDGITFGYKSLKYNLYEIESKNTDTQDLTIRLINGGLNKKRQFKIRYA